MSLIQLIKQRAKKGRQTILTFIDLKAAYDRVDRVKVMQLIQQKKILDEDQIQLLKFLWSNDKTCCGD